ncbi:Ty1/Copia family ribonuclease HI, partial [Klebsiella pneumoniae]|uniref:Ty1/Copia family ribonuclease HI n=1 Tax=Klebsiella pneumoniae TaxID=573 RepID=UPI003A80A100
LDQDPVQLYFDNQASISLIKNGAVNSKNKHTMVKYHYVHEMLENNEIAVDYISTNDMVADPLTKGIPEDMFAKHVAQLGLRYV